MWVPNKSLCFDKFNTGCLAKTKLVVIVIVHALATGSSDFVWIIAQEFECLNGTDVERPIKCLTHGERVVVEAAALLSIPDFVTIYLGVWFVEISGIGVHFAFVNGGGKDEIFEN